MHFVSSGVRKSSLATFAIPPRIARRWPYLSHDSRGADASAVLMSSRERITSQQAPVLVSCRKYNPSAPGAVGFFAGIAVGIEQWGSAAPVPQGPGHGPAHETAKQQQSGQLAVLIYRLLRVSDDWNRPSAHRSTHRCRGDILGGQQPALGVAFPPAAARQIRRFARARHSSAKADDVPRCVVPGRKQ